LLVGTLRLRITRWAFESLLHPAPASTSWRERGDLDERN
jgi:hypothetical protein